MAMLFCDSYDFYKTYADLALRWIIGSYVPSFVPAANTAFGTGQALQVTDLNGLALSMQGNFVTTGALGGNEPTIFLSFRLKALPGIGIGQQFHVILITNSSPQVDVQFTGDGSIVVRTGGSSGFVIKTQPAAFVINTWDSWQIKIFISTTAGTVEVRKNGSSAAIFVITNVDTQATTGTASANGLQLYNNTAGTTTPFWQIDDLYVNSANDAAPITWPGDVRGTIVEPTGAVQTQFVAFPSAPNYAAVADAQPDGDTTYVQATVIGTEDLYSLSATTAQNVIGVNIFADLKRTDTGNKTAGIQVKLSGGTDTSVLTINPSLSYAWQTIYLAVDPTGATWTPTSVATMNLGIKVIV